MTPILHALDQYRLIYINPIKQGPIPMTSQNLIIQIVFPYGLDAPAACLLTALKNNYFSESIITASDSPSGSYHCISDILLLMDLALNKDRLLYIKFNSTTDHLDHFRACLTAFYWKPYHEGNIPSTAECVHLLDKHRTNGIETLLHELLVLSHGNSPVFIEVN